MLNLNYLIKKPFILILGVLCGFLIILSWFLGFQEFKILEIEPNNPVNISLNQNFNFKFAGKPNNLKITISPNLELTQNVYKNYLVIAPKNSLEPNTNYIIAINNNNKLVYSYSFNTRGLLESEAVQEETNKVLNLYPLIEFLPIDNDQYHLTYSGPLTLGVDIKNAKQEEVEKEIRNWIISKNVDPKTHKIIFNNP